MFRGQKGAHPVGSVVVRRVVVIAVEDVTVERKSQHELARRHPDTVVVIHPEFHQAQRHLRRSGVMPALIARGRAVAAVHRGARVIVHRDKIIHALRQRAEVRIVGSHALVERVGRGGGFAAGDRSVQLFRQSAVEIYLASTARGAWRG